MGTYPLFLGAMKFDSPDGWAPLTELIDPIVQGGLGHNDHVWAMNATVLLQVAQQRDRLQGLAQPLQQIFVPQLSTIFVWYWFRELPEDRAAH